MTDAEFAQFLDDISSTFMAADFDGWAAHVQLPFSFITQTGPLTSTTTAELEENFNLYLLAKRNVRLDLMLRRAMSVEICDDLTVIGTYETELLSNGVRVRPPYVSSVLLHRSADGWRMSCIMNAVGHHYWTGQYPNRNGD
ncbi:hypothetical protein [Puniceibacterium sp. IMCC21224]|uniref:hypothetical protein n=1 Tax=Puniceibacterium sp. IMCC21224 TaxID=1618204 RepID=UPI00064DFB5F|nr:hypothetical protein [Puniceibacterium sp. IMCC21224]KMK66021.1 hypothetical protein IMCC21224_11867 [Puniceibacterium sp. IMCC21224]